MCCKNGSKVIYVLFRATEVTPGKILSNNSVYHHLEVFKQFPNPNEVLQVMKKNLVDRDSIKVMKVEIPYSKLF